MNPVQHDSGRGRGDPVATLASALDAHIMLMRDLVEVSQREQQHLIAFETRALAACTEEKRVLMSQIAASEASVRQALDESYAAFELTPEGEEQTITELVGALPEARREELSARTSQLRSLTGSLQELQAMSLVHAERGLLFVKAYTSLLKSVQGEESDEPNVLYDSTGRARREPAPGSTVSRNA